MNANSVAIGYAAGKGTLASVPQGQNSIAIGAGAGAGFGSAGVPANSLTLSSMRTSTTASNLLTYNTTTKEVSNVAAINIDPINNKFAIGNNTGVNAGNGTFASGIDTGKDSGVNCYSSGISSGNNTGANQTSIGIAAGNNAVQSVCIGLNAGNGTFNATCIGNSAGSVGLGTNSVAIGTNASPTNGSANSICIVGDGTTLNPPNNGLFISPIRSAASATNQLTYNTTTKEIQYAPSTGSLTYAQATFTNLSINNGIGSLTFTSGAESLFIPTAGTWQVSGWYRLASSVAGGGLQLNGSSFYMATQSGDPYEYGQLSSHFYEIFTSVNTSLTFTHNISYTMTTAIPLVLTGRITTGGFNFAALNGQGEFYAIKLA